MRTNKFTTLVLLLIGLLACCSVATATDETPAPLFAKFGTILPSDHPTVRSLLSFQKRIERLLHGQFTIQIFPDAQLGTGCDLLEGIQFGNIELGVVSLELLTPQTPLLASISMPYIFRDYEHQLRVLDGPIGRHLLQSLENVNLIGLGFLDTGTRNILITHADFHAPRDFQDQQIGVITSCPNVDTENLILQLSQQYFHALGAEGKVVSAKESLSELLAESLTGLEIPSLFPGLTEHEYAAEKRYIIQTGHILVPDVIVASKRWFDALPVESQEALLTSASTMIRRQRGLWSEANREWQATLETTGIEFKPVDKAAFRESVDPVRHLLQERLGNEFDRILEAINQVK